MKDATNSYPVVIAAPAQAFYHLVLLPCGEIHKLCFSVKDETNIRYYLVEGSHDMITFEGISRIYAKGVNSLPRTYDATIRNTSYKYYRIRQVDNTNMASDHTQFKSTNITDQTDSDGGREITSWKRIQQYTC